jgi:O-antigen ligase
MSAITIYFSIDGFFYLQALNEAKSPENLATYQGFARSYIYTFLIVISTVNAVGARFLLYGLATSSLFLNGARAEFSAVIFMIPLIETYHARHKLYSIIPFFLVLILFAVSLESVVGMLPDNRTLQLLDLSHSSSINARQQLSANAWRTITENPVFGDFASYPDGHYAHNILCAWVDFGLVGFVFLAALLVCPIFSLYVNGYFLKANRPISFWRALSPITLLGRSPPKTLSI